MFNIGSTPEMPCMTRNSPGIRIGGISIGGPSRDGVAVLAKELESDDGKVLEQQGICGMELLLLLLLMMREKSGILIELLGQAAIVDMR